MPPPSPPPASPMTGYVAAGALPAWQVGELPLPPAGGWHNWMRLLGPGVLLAGASVGTGEWLFGPAVSAQYGGTLLWLATISILLQVFCNLEFMRYTLYCGEPILVGGLRTRPGPVFWMIFYAVLDVAAVWPYNASNAAVPLAAAILGHLPGSDSVSLLVVSLSEKQFVKFLGYVIFLAAFVPLVFGGTIYKMLERAMAIKLVIVLGYLLVVALFMVSATNAREVFAGFFRFGTVPLRADTVIVGRHFTLMGREGRTSYTVKGTLENGRPLVTEFKVTAKGAAKTYKIDQEVPADLRAVRGRLVDKARRIAQRGGFFVEHTELGTVLRVEGRLAPDRSWRPERFSVAQAGGPIRQYARLEDVPPPLASRLRQLVDNQGLEHANLIGYWSRNRRLPDLDWAMLAAFAAIAGAGGLTNTTFSNFCRDKGWGMGVHVGAIPSAVGGRKITLSHVGMVFRPSETPRGRWRGWMRHIVKDQVVVWMVCSFVGMALPCMLSLEFIRNAPVEGNRVAAMTAEGMANRYPDYAQLLWLMTLLVGFLILAPGQIIGSDQVARRWTDVVWSAIPRARRLGGHQVTYVYYGIMVVYGIWGMAALALFDPLQTAKIGAVLQNIALGSSALLALYVNRSLLPRELAPSGLMQAGTALCGAFFLGISVLVLVFS